MDMRSYIEKRAVEMGSQRGEAKLNYYGEFWKHKISENEKRKAPSIEESKRKRMCADKE